VTISDRIQRLIDVVGLVKVKDGAGIVTPEGVDYAVRLKAYKECLAIAVDVEGKHE
jgi:hypothetical protein